MPILYSQLVLPPPEPPVPVEAPAYRIGAQWLAPSGAVLNLTDCPGGLDIGRNRAGEDMPTPAFVEDDLVDGDGSVPRGVRAVPRTYVLPLLVHAEDHTTWRALHQHLLRSLSPWGANGVPQLGRYRVHQVDGTWRELRCAYSGGAEGEGINDRRGLWYRAYAVLLRAFDPWWYGPGHIVSWQESEVGPFFPILPVSLGSGSVLGASDLEVAGDVPTSGVWRITGPADGTATLRSETLDQELVLDLSGAHELAAGQTLTVDMRKGQQSIKGPGGASWWSARVGTPQMWQLRPGVNSVSLTVTGAGPGTLVELTYEPRYLTA